MVPRRLLWQLYPVQIAITLVALIVVTWYASYVIREFHFEQTTEDLKSRAILAAPEIGDLLRRHDYDALNELCHQIGRRSSTRLTVIAPDGKVLADSHEEPERMDNHAGRPEIAAALDGRVNPVNRFSYTLQKPMIYVAIPVIYTEGEKAVIRTSVPVTSLTVALRGIYTRIALAVLPVILLVALIAWWTTRKISYPLEAMRQQAMRFARGEFTSRLRPAGSIETVELARTLNQMAAQLDERFRTIVRQRNELRAVFDSMIEGLLIVDSNGLITGINRAGASFLEIAPERVQGKSVLEVVRNLELLDFVKRSLKSSESLEDEIAFTDPSGNDRYFQVHGVRIQDYHDRDTKGGLIVFNDVTNIHRLENMRRDFVANVSHELKTPITSIEGFVETLLDGAMDDKENAGRFLEIVAQQSRRLRSIVEDLLALSQIEQKKGKSSIEMKVQRLRPSLQAAIESCKTRATEKGISIDLNCPDELQAEINSRLLEQAVINLVDNAVKYSPAHSRVQVEANRGKRAVIVAVKDEGIGIARKDQERLFERFYRVDKARSRKIGGTGLGLSIVKHIVETHHGSIEIQSAPGQGATFSIRLPLPGSCR